MTESNIKTFLGGTKKKLLQWHWGMGPSVKHVLGVQEWSYDCLEFEAFVLEIRFCQPGRCVEAFDGRAFSLDYGSWCK